jgi:hypothetical protein
MYFVVLIFFICISIILFIIYVKTLPDDEDVKTLPDAEDYVQTPLPKEINAHNLLCRMNTRNYLENFSMRFDLIELISPHNLQIRVQIGFTKPTILFIIDDPFASSDQSAKNYSNFLDNDNILLCIAEDWLDEPHPKLLLWPIGLESRMVQDKNLREKLLHKMSTPKEGKGIMCNAHFRTWKNPASLYRDDREDMITDLKDQKMIVNFWGIRHSQRKTLDLTQNNAYNLCPEGNGLDTHRFYETFALGVHPVVRRGPLTELHRQFETTKVVDSWKDVAQLETIRPALKPNMKKLTIGYWLYNSLRSRCKIVTFFTGNLCDEWRNLVFTMRKVNLIDLLVVFPLDDTALTCCKNEGVEFRTDLVLNNLPGEASFGKKHYKNIVKVKLKAIKIILQENYFVLYVDTDIVFFQDPFVHIFNLPPKDIYFQSDNGREDDAFSAVIGKTNLCSGFMFIIPNKKCIELMDQSLDVIEKSKSKIYVYDQDAINYILKSKNKQKEVDYGILSPSLFPNGVRFFEKRKQCANNPFIVHNNYIVGLDAKVNRFKKYGLWYVV